MQNPVKLTAGFERSSKLRNTMNGAHRRHVCGLWRCFEAGGPNSTANRSQCSNKDGALPRISLKHSQFTEIGGHMVPAYDGRGFCPIRFANAVSAAVSIVAANPRFDRP
jgi:hypothetical protein